MSLIVNRMRAANRLVAPAFLCVVLTGLTWKGGGASPEYFPALFFLMKQAIRTTNVKTTAAHMLPITSWCVISDLEAPDAPVKKDKFSVNRLQ